MKTSRFIVVLATALTLTSFAQAKPKVKILATGETIAGAQTSSSEVGYKSGSFPVDDLMLGLMRTSDPKKLQQHFMEY